MDPITQRLVVHPTDLRRRAPVRPSLTRSQRQEPPIESMPRHRRLAFSAAMRVEAGAEERINHDVAAIAEIEERVLQHGDRLDGWVILEAAAGVGAER